MPRDVSVVWRFGIGLLLTVTFAQVAVSQRGFPGREPTGQYPSPTYYTALELYRDGDLVSALELFDLAVTQGRRTTEGRWLDSIPAIAMRAECHYQLGDCVAAAEGIEAVMGICKANARWLSRVVWDTLPDQGAVRSQRQWLWPAAASLNVVPLRRSVQFEAGVAVTEQVIARGGTIEPFNIKVLDIAEVMRAIATAMHRRRILLGPLSADDPSVASLRDAIKYPANLAAPLPRALIGSLRGCAYFASLSDDRTVAAVSSTTVGGAVHDLSPITLLAALHTASVADDVSAKVAGAMQAANVAAAVGQTEWVGPSLQLAAGFASPQSAAEVATQCGSIAAALARRGRFAALHAAVASADAFVKANQLDAANGMLQSAAEISARRDVYCPRVDAYAAWVAARIAAAASSGANGGSSSGTTRESAAATASMLDPVVSRSLDKVYAFANGDLRPAGRGRSSRRGPMVTLPRVLQQMRLPAILSASGTSSSAGGLASLYIGDSPRWLWRTDPVDALGSLGYDRTGLHRVRIGLAMATGNAEDIARAANDYSIDRFVSQLPIGGRAANVRTMSWTPIDLMDESLVKYIDASPTMKDFRSAVSNEGENPSLANSMRRAANRIALSPEHIPAAVMPVLDSENVAGGFPADTAVLAIVEVDQVFQFVAWTGGRFQQWRMPAGPIKKSLAGYLASIGISSGSSRLPATEREIQQSHSWRERLVRSVFPDDQFWQSVSEQNFVIVPDGVLWYLPFAALPIEFANDGDQDPQARQVTLGQRYSLRYAASLGSLRFAAANPPVNNAIALATGAFFAPRDGKANADVIDQLVAIDGVDVGNLPTMPSAQIGATAGHLVVASPRGINPADPLAFLPSPTDPARPEGTLAAWMDFPHHPPTSAFLPGLRSGISAGGDGREIFMVLAAMRAAGVRDVILSRWAVGGDSTALLLNEYLHEVAATDPSTALQRARILLRQKEIVPVAEPLLGKPEAKREDITGDEPLFWASYLIAG